MTAPHSSPDTSSAAGELTPREAFAPLRELAATSPARGSALLLLLLLAIAASEEGEASGAAGELADASGLGERTVRDHLHWLRDAGELTPLGRRGGARRRALAYRVRHLAPSSPVSDTPPTGN